MALVMVMAALQSFPSSALCIVVLSSLCSLRLSPFSSFFAPPLSSLGEIVPLVMRSSPSETSPRLCVSLAWDVCIIFDPVLPDPLDNQLLFEGNVGKSRSLDDRRRSPVMLPDIDDVKDVESTAAGLTDFFGVVSDTDTRAKCLGVRLLSWQWRLHSSRKVAAFGEHNYLGVTNAFGCCWYVPAQSDAVITGAEHRA
eukprot:CAMPEP_0206561398 /NCGR_PEP_ID=MMETSP0325_2-20121206/21583_1 /ASSEMBLY_ACC=CAM_ASM_000347 /TAXON_ID=2866 /ORGANISM="Crypthecodinium cohnii, Strain Seligo" /LENGTH=196 /DNA_ID=CAMNT_0054063317 /DNA_START=319 /DNA_END=907 /DNA_ORIENTATION=+